MSLYINIHFVVFIDLTQVVETREMIGSLRIKISLSTGMRVNIFCRTRTFFYLA